MLVSVADDVDAAFGATRVASPVQLPPFRAITKVRRPQDRPPHQIESAGRAADVAFTVADGIQRARRELQPGGRVHLFMAVPVGLAVLIGQLLNTLGEVQTYEHEPYGVVGFYPPAARLSSAG